MVVIIKVANIYGKSSNASHVLPHFNPQNNLMVCGAGSVFSAEMKKEM